MKLKVYSASAGSGKTYTLARDVIDQLILDPSSYERLLAVTFTNKATGEMKERIVGDLHLMVAGDAADPKRQALIDHHTASTGLDEPALLRRCASALRKILNDYGRFSVSTIDRFVQRLLRSFAYEQGLSANYALVLDNDDLVDGAVDNMMETLPTDAELRGHIVGMTEDRMDEKGGWAIDKEIRKLGKMLLDDKGANIPDDRDLLAHLRDLASQLRDLQTRSHLKIRDEALRLAESIERRGISKPNGNSFKSIQLILDNIPPSAPPRTATERDELREWAEKAANKFAKDLTGKLVAKGTKGDVDGWKKDIDDIRAAARHHGGLATAAAAVRRNIKTLAVMGKLNQHIAEIEQNENTRALGSSGLMLRELIDGCSVPFIYEKCGARYDTIMIDEFQDTSRVQYENFKPLLENSLGEGHDCLIVGDVKQSIYRFREGDWRLLGKQVEQDFKETVRKPLSYNFRSRKEIVELNNEIFSALPQVMDDALRPGDEDDATAGPDSMEAMYGDYRQEPRKDGGGYARIEILQVDGDKSFKTAKEHALREFVDALRRLHDENGYSYSDVCVLVRNRKDGNDLIERFSAEGIPVMSDDSLLVMNSDATLCMADAMRYISSGERTPLFSAVKTLTGLDVASLAREWETIGPEWAARLDALRGLGLAEMAGELINLLPAEMRDGESPYIDAFVQRLRESIAEGVRTLDAFVRIVNEEEGKWVLSATSGDEAVRVMTVHKSKGLEFKVVLIHALDWEITHKGDAELIWVPIGRLGLPDEHWSGLQVPVDCVTALADSAFNVEYANEMRAKFEDNLNTVYVALTRPTDVLMAWGVYAKPKEKGNGKGRISRYVLAAMERAGSATEDSNIEIETDGEPLACRRVVTEKGTMPQKDTLHPAVQATPTAHMDIPMAHLYSPSASPAINSQVEMDEYERRADMVSYGLTMHSLLASVATADDIDKVVGDAVTDGLVLEADAPQIVAELRKRTSEPGVAQWFDGSMTDVWAETTMVGPDRRLRPDRIMRSADGRTVVVDYKFGRTERREHAQQVRLYVEWLRKAGFANVEAHLWYYTLGKVVRVAG